MGLTKAANTEIQMDNDSEGDASGKTVLREFFWDKVITTMLVLIFGVTSIETVASYFNNDVLTCLVAENYTETVQSFMNQLCIEELPSYGKNFKIILYVQVVALSALHVFWTQVWNGYIDTFKSAIASMSLKRDRTTGRFPASDFATARYLENNFKDSALMWTYITKIAGQIVVSVIGIALTFFGGLEFDEILTFTCNSSAFPQWPLAEPDIQCTHYEELQNLQILRWLNFSVQIVVIGANICAVAMLGSSIYFYNVNIGYKRVAEFVLYTGIRREYYPQYHGQSLKTSIGVVISLFNLKLFKNFKFRLPEELKKFQEEQRQWDMMFLIRRLIATNSKQGGAFLDVLIDNHLDFLCENVCGEWYQHYYKEPSTRVETDHGELEPTSKLSDSERNVGELIFKAVDDQFKSHRNSVKLNAVLVTDQNETLAFILNKLNLQDSPRFKKVVNNIILSEGMCFKDIFMHCQVIYINFNDDISPSEEDSVPDRSSDGKPDIDPGSDNDSSVQNRWPWPDILHVPSHLWSVHQKYHLTQKYLRKVRT